MFAKIVVLISMFLMFGTPSDDKKIYHKEYYETGKPKAEGWIKNSVKTDYWKYYHSNGKLAKEGHYNNGKRVAFWRFFNERGISTKEGHYEEGKSSGWWVFYDTNGKIDYKCQLANGVKNGYCLQYNFGKMTSASKYKDGKKLKEWYSYRSFRHENSLSDLR